MKKDFFEPCLEIVYIQDMNDVLTISDSWAKDKDIWPTQLDGSIWG